MFPPLCHVIVVKVEDRMLPQLPLSKIVWSGQSILLCTLGAPSGTWRKSPVISTRRLSSEKRGEMSMLRRFRNLWIPCVATIVLGCFNDAVAQVRYQVTDLGTLKDGLFGCTMGLNNHGWTETQYGELNALGQLVNGR